uniref:non-specific serine/threonine protein kinase n=1 Tax=Chaetoceros debilis TaxID=122233 RepID=A0A7S3Q6P5_9STRA|mmetsp:Transcript_14155/g.21162  ORF Transcript_14155/g.21162 Transcript_14155/m.21162 type:complete len:1254 (-) Transcript_14155:634-4395(-)
MEPRAFRVFFLLSSVFFIAVINAVPAQQSPSAIIISTVDGIIFTLDAYHGTLRGMVQSGSSLVSPSSTIQPLFESAENDNSSTPIMQIIPGLDGTLYSYTDRLTPLPVTMKDIIDTGPISTCMSSVDGNGDDNANDASMDDCGVIIGEAKSKLIALDVDDGSIAWVRNEGSLLHGRANISSKHKNTVLLQREDFSIRQVNIDNGEDTWKVHLGSIKALDVKKQSTGRSYTSGKSMGNLASDATQLGRSGSHQSESAFHINSKIGARTNGNAIINANPKVANDFTRPTGDILFEQPFPSVAFGSNGMTLYCLDTIHQDVLWSKQFDSNIASVYGVVSSRMGGGASFVDLKVVDREDEDYEDVSDGIVSHHGVTGKPSSIATSEEETFHTSNPSHPPQLTIVPLSTSSLDGNNQYRNQNLPATANSNDNDGVCAYIGKHDNAFFVASTSKSERNSSNIHYREEQSENILNLFDTGRSDRFEFVADHDTDVQANISHKTEHGLFITWSHVGYIFIFVMIAIVAGRYTYKKRKKAWITLNSPALISLAKIELSKEAELESLSTLNLGRVNTSGGKSSTDLIAFEDAGILATSPFAKSASLPEINLLSKGLSGENKRVSLSATKVESSDASSVFHNNIDGIPLVRYSRYTSEFDEILPLGKGGFGTVFKCMSKMDGREYAVKKVLIRSYVDADGHLPAKFSQKLQKVLREVKILALLDHANIVRYYTAWLEVGDNDFVADNLSSLGQRTNDGLHSRAFSSNLLAGITTFTNSPTRSEGSHHSHHNAANTFMKHDTQRNPLGWNNFMNESIEQDDMSLERKISTDSKKTFEKQGNSDPLASSNDLGFNWDTSHTRNSTSHLIHAASQGSFATSDNSSLNSSDDESSTSSSDCSDSEASSESSQNDSKSRWSTIDEDETGPPVIEKRNRQHILYIQMQLSKKTLLDYFHSREGNIDIPVALRIFGHIARGVEHVHKQGLIHRDLKPSNCFMDDSDVIKIGDFGLSRESGAQNEEEGLEVATQSRSNLGYEEDNVLSAGVGTSSYASPEQMRCSEYDSSSDVYSLGIILFELCYPMQTGMERFKAFEGIRRNNRREFPIDWQRTIKSKFPSIDCMLQRMLSHYAKDRPTAAEVAAHVESVLGEYTVLSLDKSSRTKGSIFLRVEAIDNEGVLTRTIKMIKESTPLVQVLQKSLRAKDSKAIMEFALSVRASDDGLDCDVSTTIQLVLKILETSCEIKVVRIINDTTPSQQQQHNQLPLLRD